MPRKVFVAGPLSSADVQTYLMEQALITCTSTTRPATPPTGQAISETDTKKLRVYSGTGWRHLGPYRVITGTSGTGTGFAGTTAWVDTGIKLDFTTATEAAQIAVGLTGDAEVVTAGGGALGLGLSLDSALAAAVVATGWNLFDKGLPRATLPLYLADTVVAAPGAHTLRLWRNAFAAGGAYNITAAFRCQALD